MLKFRSYFVLRLTYLSPDYENAIRHADIVLLVEIKTERDEIWWVEKL